MPVVTGGRDLTRRLVAAMAAFQITKHLLDLGHEHISIVTDHPQRKSIHDRYRGVREAFHEYGLRLSRNRLTRLSHAELTAQRAEVFDKLLHAGSMALLCFENELAVELYHACEEAGVNVPDDLSLASFDNLGFLSIDPTLMTHVEQPLAEIGRRAVELVLQQASGKPGPEPEVSVAATVVLGRSTGRLRDPSARSIQA